MHDLLAEQYIYGKDYSVGLRLRDRDVDVLTPVEWNFDQCRTKEPVVTMRLKWNDKLAARRE